MVRDDHDFFRVPNLGVLTELALEHPDRAGAADVVRHQRVHVYPDVFARGHLALARCPGQYFFSQRHRSRSNVPAHPRSRKEALTV